MSVLHTKPDGDGNFIMAEQKDNIIVIFLKLVSERHKRKLGVVNIPARTFHTTRERAKHLFRKFDAYGFCYQLLKDAKKFDTILLEDETNKWKLPVAFILDNPTYLHFKGNGGFELQVFVPLKVLDQFKVSTY